MKRMNITIAGLAVLLSMVTYASADAISVREELAMDNSIKALYTIDEYHTYIVKGPGKALDAGKGGFTIVKESDGTYIIRHSKAQPVVNKTRNASLDMTLLSNGDNYKVQAMVDPGAEFYAHAYKLCGGGAVTFVAPKSVGGFKRLAEVTPLEAFEYAIGEGSRSGAWYMSCNGDKRFIVEKNHRFLTGGVETAVVLFGRNLEGVNYVKDIGAVKVADRRPASVDKAGFLEEMAREVASVEMDFVRPYNGDRYSAAYMGTDSRDCHLAAITYEGKGSAESLVATVYEFRVCADKAAKLGEKEIQKGGDARTYYANVWK